MSDGSSAHLPLTATVRAMAGNLGWLLASRGFAAVLSLVYLGIVTRTLGVTQFGRFALITGAAQTIAVLVGFQTWQIVVRYGVDHLARGDEGALARLLRACVALDVVSALVGILLSVAILYGLGDLMGIGPRIETPTLLFAIVQLITIRSTALGILRLRDRYSSGAVADAVTPMARLMGAAGAALFWPNVRGFMFAWAVAEVLTAATYWIMVARTGDLATIRRARADRRIIARENPGIGRFMLTTNANATLGLSTKQFPLLLVGGYGGTAAAGAFRLAVQLAQALAKLAQLLARAAFPEFVRAVRAGGAAVLTPLLGRALASSAGVALAILIAVALAGEWLLGAIGGPAFIGAYVALLWLAAAGCIDLTVATFEPVLMAVGRAGRVLTVRVTATVLQFAAMLALLPRLGAEGAAIGVLVGSLAAAAMLGLAIRRYARTR